MKCCTKGLHKMSKGFPMIQEFSEAFNKQF